jgi:hypothetical protein
MDTEIVTAEKMIYACEEPREVEREWPGILTSSEGSSFDSLDLSFFLLSFLWSFLSSFLAASATSCSNAPSANSSSGSRSACVLC